MRMKNAMLLINGEPDGFMVSFEWAKNGMLRGDHFPDKHANEPLIKTETEAWVLAEKFAEKTKGDAVNIYVTNSDFTPVAGCQNKTIANR